MGILQSVMKSKDKIKNSRNGVKKPKLKHVYGGQQMQCTASNNTSNNSNIEEIKKKYNKRLCISRK